MLLVSKGKKKPTKKMPGDTYPKFKVAAVQAAPIFQNRDATVEKCARLIEEAAKNGAKIAAFSEGFISGFPRNSKFETPEITRTKYLDLFRNAMEIPGKDTDVLCEVARQNNALEKFAMYASGEVIHIASWPPFPKPKMAAHGDYVKFATRQHAVEGKRNWSRGLKFS